MINMENQVCLFLRDYQPSRESCRSACGFLKAFCLRVKHDGQARVDEIIKAQMMREFTKLNLHSASLFFPYLKINFPEEPYSVAIQTDKTEHPLRQSEQAESC